MLNVQAWEEKIIIPTYKLGEPDKNPMFLEKRVYQGSSGVVYPHPVIDKVYDDKEDKEYTALYLENDYLKVMILPELGGRIQMAYDKTNDYHFIYYNSVIKPALVGLAGPWISGGIEFNWPQHHRPSTFDPCDYTIEENPDGSKTVWVNEYEIMFRTKCALGFTLYPDKAYIELHAKIYNRTPFPQTFLWWANPAVAVDEHYQSVFPPDIHAVYDHGKRDVSSFPIATGTYYKVDYSPGTDISRYSNIPVPTSYMAVNSEFNFVGGYHHKKKAGMLHVADHHVSPGKKQWTWGCGEFGKAWDRQLTDTDGPYFELMCGVFTDNQPDFSWIMPNEVREFKQYFMPYKEVGYVKNASVDAVVNLEIENNIASINVYLTKEREVTILLQQGDETLFSEVMILSPRLTFSKEISLAQNLSDKSFIVLKVLDENKNVLVEYTPVTKKDSAIPDPASPIGEPGAIHSNEDLYLAGLHLEQYRHATYLPSDYYEEALRRDPSDIRCNNALGLLLLRKGEYKKAESYLRKAVEKLYKHNPNPYNGEPLYNLGLCLTKQKQYAEALNWFNKSAWNAAMQDSAYLQIAAIECIKDNWPAALQAIEKSLARNYNSPKARHLKAIVLRKLNRLQEAQKWTEVSLEMDKFDFGSWYEMFNIHLQSGETNKATAVANRLQVLMRDAVNSYIEIAIDYANCHLFTEAASLLSLLTTNEKPPLYFYYLACYNSLLGETEKAKQFFEKAFDGATDCVFPNRLEDVDILLNAVEVNNADYKALHYLGNFYYAKRRYKDAQECWEKAITIHSSFATTHRNLGIAYFNKLGWKEKALSCFEKAFACNPTDSRVLFELDQLYKRLNKPVTFRLRFLENHKALIEDRDDFYLEYILLHSVTGAFAKAAALLKARKFHPWEGGEGKTSGQHIFLHVELAKQAIKNKNPEEALELLQMATVYPHNLGEGKLYGAQENDIYYWMGCAHAMLSEKQAAETCWLQASTGLDEPAPAIFYNDQQPDKIFYQGMAMLKLNRNTEAETRFLNLVRYSQENMNKEVKIDYFAVSLPDLSIFDDDLNLRNKIHCHYLAGLGFLGLKQDAKAAESFMQVLELDPVHLGAITHEALLQSRLAHSEVVAEEVAVYATEK